MHRQVTSHLHQSDTDLDPLTDQALLSLLLHTTILGPALNTERRAPSLHWNYYNLLCNVPHFPKLTDNYQHFSLSLGFEPLKTGCMPLLLVEFSASNVVDSTNAFAFLLFHIP